MLIDPRYSTLPTVHDCRLSGGYKVPFYARFVGKDQVGIRLQSLNQGLLGLDVFHTRFTFLWNDCSQNFETMSFLFLKGLTGDINVVFYSIASNDLTLIFPIRHVPTNYHTLLMSARRFPASSRKSFWCLVADSRILSQTPGVC